MSRFTKKAFEPLDNEERKILESLKKETGSLSKTLRKKKQKQLPLRAIL